MTQTPSPSIGMSPALYAARLGEAESAYRSGNVAKSIEILESIAAQKPDDVRVLSNLGRMNVLVGRAAAGRDRLETALKLRPGDAEDLRSLASAYRALGFFKQAGDCLDQVLVLLPGNLQAIAMKAEMCVLAGDEQSALEMIDPHVRAGALAPSIGWVFAKVAPKAGRMEEALAYLRKVEATQALDPGRKASLFFSMGDVLDRLKRYDEAFDCFKRANDLVQIRYDPVAVEAAVDRVIQVWNREAIASMPSTGSSDESMMFIVGMPRSGTTLVEQILSCLPGVHAAGERGDIPAVAMSIMGKAIVGLPLIVFPELVTAEKVAEGARKTMQAMRVRDPDAVRMIDKLPQNFAFLGLIQLMFPKARVIHCSRHPLDTCVSCYVNQFFGWMPFAYRLETLGHFYRQYVKLMNHWKSVLDIPIIDMPYEGLIENFEPRARELVAFTGLPWTDDCLRFHEHRRVALTSSNAQVRSPLYSSSAGRWRNYDKHLAPLRQALGDVVPPDS